MNLPDLATRWRGISRNVMLLGLVSFFTDVSSDMIVPLLPAFLSTLGLGVVFLGWLEGVADSITSLLKLISGWVSDKLQHKKMLVVVGYTLSTVMLPAMALVSLGWQVMALRSADRVGKGIRTAPRDALIATSCAPEMRGRAFGFQRTCDNAGAVIGPLLASLLLLIFATTAVRYRLIFACALLPGLVAVALLFGVKERREDLPQSEIRIPPRHSMSGSESPMSRPTPLPSQFKLYLVILLVFTLGNSSDLFLLYRARNLGVADVWLPILWALLQAVKALTSWPGGILSDHLGRRPMLVTGWAIYAVAYFGFASVASGAGILLLIILYGLYYGLTEPVERALVADFVAHRPDLRGTAFGLYHGVVSIGALPASILFGWLWQKFGPAVAFHVGAALALVAAVGLVLLVRPPKKVKSGYP